MLNTYPILPQQKQFADNLIRNLYSPPSSLTPNKLVHSFSYGPHPCPDNSYPNNPSFSTDSRTLKQGNVFIALSGPKFKAIHFLPQILAKKPAAIIFPTQDAPLLHNTLPNILLPYSCIFLQVSNALFAYAALAKNHLVNLHHSANPNPLRIAIVGSAGKTSLKELLADSISALLQKINPILSVSKNFLNFNNEVGLPKSILNLKSPASFYVFELGISRPNEMQILSSIFQPHWVVFTNILPAHIGNFQSLNNLALAKSQIIKFLPPYGKLFLPYDISKKNILLNQLQKYHHKNIQLIYYSPSHFHTTIRFSKKKSLFSSSLSPNPNQPKSQPPIHIKLNGFFPFLQHSLAASCSILQQILLSPLIKSPPAYNLNNSLQSALQQTLANLKPLPNRLQLLYAKNAVIVDDSYNANPHSLLYTIAALKKPLEIAKISPLFILGDLLELGKYSHHFHESIGSQLTSSLPNNSKCFFYGHYMLSAFRQLKLHDKTYFYHKSILIQAASHSMHSNQLLFFKASNSIGFSSIAQSLLNH